MSQRPTHIEETILTIQLINFAMEGALEKMSAHSRKRLQACRKRETIKMIF